MKDTAMTASRSLVTCLLVACLPAGAAGQVGPTLEGASLAIATADARAAWYQRFQDARSGPAVTEEWSNAFDVGPKGSLDLSNVAGDIVVTAGGGSQIKVHAVKRARGADEAEARQVLESTVIDATETAGRLEVRTRHPRRHHVRVEVEYQVQVPAETSVTLRSVAGRVRVTGVKGEVRAESVSGDVEVTSAQHVTRARSISGDVAVTDAANTDVLDASTVSGNLLLRRLRVRAIEAQTVSGDVLLEDAAGERAQVKSISGSLTFEGPLASGGRYEFNSHSGEVRVMVVGGTGFQVAANTFSGRLRSEVAFTDAQPETQEAGGFPGNRQLRGTVGDGSALLVVKTFSGSATVGQAKGKP
jgi:DUF4097 and DUF4098 domain-containing protein YvlB